MAINIFNIKLYEILQIIMFQFSPPVKFRVCMFLSPFLPFGKIHLLPHAALADSAVQAARLRQACLACGAAEIFAALGLI
jgi:hypothetical protein